MRDHYILDGHTPRPTELMEWAAWFQNADRTVARTEVGETLVSTVFLGIDHRFNEGPLLLFETLVLGGPLDQEMERYSTWDEATAGHATMVDRVRAVLPEHTP